MSDPLRQLSFDDLTAPTPGALAPEHTSAPMLPDDGPLTYFLERSPRRKSSIQINVQPDLAIRVVAPMRLAKAKIDAMVLQRRSWILKRREELRGSHQARLARRWVSGERLPLLDGELELRITPQPGRKMLNAKRQSDILDVTVPMDLDGTDAISRVVHKWYGMFAHRTFLERTQHFAGPLGVAPRNVLVRNQESRWGSCASDGTLRFCWRLILAPQRILDYVVVHELSHLLHHHHQPPFWSCVATILPNYRELRAELKKQGETYRL